MGDNFPYINLGTGYSANGIAAVDYFVCALLNNQKVKCWGSNEYGQLGVCSTANIRTYASQMGNNLKFIDEFTTTSPTRSPNKKRRGRMDDIFLHHF
jgi:alpha-tubulin suppressor-like RCC1 family protein